MGISRTNDDKEQGERNSRATYARESIRSDGAINFAIVRMK